MRRLLSVLLLIFPLLLSADGKPGYYRFPVIYEDIIIFTSEGDLWRVNVNGGVAQRLTTHHGVESHPAISADGTLVAFSAQYEGPTEVYTIPLHGGIPTRRTFEGGRVTVVGWTPDGKILYSTQKHSTLPDIQLIAIDLKTNKKTIVPLNQASDGVFDPSGRTLFFTRLPFQGSHTKLYKGGTAQNLWKYSIGSEESIPLTGNYPGTSKMPIYWQRRIYFVSDRDGTMNLWSMKEDGKDLKQHTFHKGWDVNHPCLHNGRIVYQLVADLYLFNIATGNDRKIDISLTSDFEHMREKWVKKPMDYLASVHLSPNGDRIVLTARGQVFVAPAKQGRLVQATRKNGVRYRNARFMPDGKSIIVLSDESGELEYWRIPANGVGEDETLTKDGKVFRYEGISSPDGKLIAYSDKNYHLWIYNIEEKKSKCIAISEISNFYNLTWSPDSKWLAYVATADNLFSQIMFYNIDNGESTALTSDRVDSYSPAWSPDGTWLYFLSDRFFQSIVRSPWGPRQPEPFFDKTTKIYMAALTSKERSPFLPDDELQLKKEIKKGTKEKDNEKDVKKEKDKTIKIELEGIQKRIMEVPVPPGNYGGLSVNKKNLFWIEAEVSRTRKLKLKALEIKNTKVEAQTLMEDISRYELSQDGKRIMVGKKDNIFIIDATNKPPAKLSEKIVDLSQWTFSINPHEEWRQMFIEAWRLERDYFYDPNLHGVDYEGMLNRYLPFVERVTDRDELSDLIAHLVGELCALHIFVRGGDRRRGQDNISPASLGAILIQDEQNGGYRIDHIYQGDPDYLDQLSPLAKPELNIQEGDIILAINGVPLLSVPDPAILLRNKVGQQVLLKLKSIQLNKLYEAIVKPISQSEEENLRYSGWEYQRRLIVEEKSKGEIGYVHLRAMGGRNYSEWARNFYPVFNRKGLIIDVRHNRGGNIDSWILEKLLRKAWFYWKPRVGKPIWNMQYAFRGHMVVLCNEFTASDGEAFTEGFRRLGLGKVIGTRTWGGEIWLSFRNFLVDNGIASAAETGVYGPEGEWLIEGHGVDPDIVIDNLPHATFKGQDAQLDAAIKYLQEKIKQEPVDVPKPPRYPKKSVEYE